jgi:uncharacterized membrane protein YgcG
MDTWFFIALPFAALIGVGAGLWMKRRGWGGTAANTADYNARPMTGGSNDSSGGASLGGMSGGGADSGGGGGGDSNS